MQIMKILYLFLSLHLITSVLTAQEDPEALKILDQVSAKAKNNQTIQADFELVIDNKRENKTSKSKGFVKIKGEKYFMESMGTQVYFDGKTLWSYMADVNEVNISQPDSTSDDFVENPAKLFSFYNRDFKYHLVGETKLDEGWMYEIDLFPKSLDQPYSRIKIYIFRDTFDLFMVKAVSKEGIDYSAFIRNTKYNIPMSDGLFSFQPAKHKGIEIVDLRNTK
jgi:outer membrane lipoprotein carrier protein